MKVKHKTMPVWDAHHAVGAIELSHWLTTHRAKLTWTYHVSPTSWYAVVELDDQVYGPVERGQYLVIEYAGGRPVMFTMDEATFTSRYDVVSLT